jgi:hypothetical protein
MVTSADRIRLGASQLTRSVTMKRLLATSLFAVGTYSLTLLAGTPAASANAPAGVVITLPYTVLSPVTAALADGDDIRARFIFETTSNRLSVATGAIAVRDVAVLSAATAALADGDDWRARFLVGIDDTHWS